MTTDAIDVAFSFLAQDEPIAVALAERLRRRLRSFVFSEAQKDIAGKDGAAEFTALYGERAALVAVLYRAGYGQTKWTRLEQSAVTSRGVELGWHTIVVISLDGTKPTWIPASRLWLGYQQFGADVVAEVLLERHADLGVMPHPETVAERAAAIAARREATARAQRLAHSEWGVRAARQELKSLAVHLTQQVEQFGAGATGLNARYSEPKLELWRCDLEGMFVTFGWALQYSNSLDGATMLVREGARPRSPVDWIPATSTVKTETLYLPEVEPESERVYWRANSGPTALRSTEAMVDHHLGHLLSALEK